MDKNYQVYPEQFHPTVIERLTSASDELQNLSTEDKSSLVAALNEITGKQAIVDAIGNPLNADDKWREMAEKIKILIDEMRDELSNKGLIVRGLELEQLIEKIKEIPEDTEEIRADIIGILTEKIGSPTTPEDSVNEMGEKIDAMTQEFRDKLSEKGVILEGDEKISELVAKVDDVGSDEALVQALANTIGEPCTVEDSVYDICDKLEVMTDNLRDNVVNLGVEPEEDVKLSGLIDSINDITMFENETVTPTSSEINLPEGFYKGGINIAGADMCKYVSFGANWQYDSTLRQTVKTNGLTYYADFVPTLIVITCYRWFSNGDGANGNYTSYTIYRLPNSTSTINMTTYNDWWAPAQRIGGFATVTYTIESDTRFKIFFANNQTNYLDSFNIKLYR